MIKRKLLYLPVKIELKRLRQYRNHLFYTRNRPLLITSTNIKKNVYTNQYNKEFSLLYLIILTMVDGFLLRERLKSKGITLSKLSEQLNLSPQALNSRLNAKDLGINFINDIQNATGLILIDEPEINLHTDLGKKILDSIRNGLNNNESSPCITKPRIPYTAAAGSITNAVEGVSESQCEQVPVVPTFPSYDFTIIVKGDSMEPKIEGGDEVACKRVDFTSFIQWGKVHVLDTAQGVVIKRIYEDGDKIKCVSYNPEYPPFSIDKSEIYSISLVVGLLRI